MTIKEIWCLKPTNEENSRPNSFTGKCYQKFKGKSDSNRVQHLPESRR